MIDLGKTETRLIGLARHAGISDEAARRRDLVGNVMRTSQNALVGKHALLHLGGHRRKRLPVERREILIERWSVDRLDVLQIQTIVPFPTFSVAKPGGKSGKLKVVIRHHSTS